MFNWIFRLKPVWRIALIACLSWAALTEAAQPLSRSNAKTVMPPKAGKPFVIQETYRETVSETPEKGVVGLDMLIEPNHYPVIQNIFKGTPAHSQGIRVGDTILAINGVRTVNKTPREVDLLISDIPGEVVHLIILRGGKPKKYSLTVMSLGQADPTIRASFAGLSP
jgi:S1-C subfamily serine protease